MHNAQTGTEASASLRAWPCTRRRGKSSDTPQEVVNAVSIILTVGLVGVPIASEAAVRTLSELLALRFFIGVWDANS